MGNVALCSVRLLKARTVLCGNDSRLFNSIAHDMKLSAVKMCSTNILSAHHPRFRLKPSHSVVQTVNIFLLCLHNIRFGSQATTQQQEPHCKI